MTLMIVLISSLTTLLTNNAYHSSMVIEGAPHWYYQQEVDSLCAFSSSKGDLDALEGAKSKARENMGVEIQTLVQNAVYENKLKLKDPVEEQMVEKFQQDKDLPKFVQSKINYANIAYEENTRMAFAKACIPKSAVLNYEKERLAYIHKSLTLKRADDGFEQLTKEQEAQQTLQIEATN